MLEGLEQIDWGGLSHAYGPATDVPGLIRSLADGSEEVRKEAIYELFGNIVHQGSLYAATAPAVPFLVEIVDEPAVPGREHILRLLQSISEGWLDCQRYAAVRARLPSGVAERQARELPHYQSAHAAVEAGFDIYVRLLRDDEVPVRRGAAFLLATMIDRRADAAAALLEAIDDEPDDHCRGAFVLALMVLAEQQPDDRVSQAAIRRFEAVLDDEGDAQAALLGAGIGLLRLHRGEAVERVLALIQPRLAIDREIFLDLPWDEANNLFALVDSSLRQATQARIGWIIEGLQHRDPDVLATAMYCAGELCHERRAGPAALEAHVGRLVDDPSPDVCRRAIQGLAGLGKVGFGRLNTLRRHALPEVRAAVADALKRIQSHKKERASWLVERRPLLLPAVSRLITTIIRHQGSRKWDDEQQVRDAVISLGFHGPKAIAAVELLRSLSDLDSPWIRVHAIRALWKITRDPALVVPVLRNSLRPEPAAFLVLDCLKQIGPAAGEVLAELRHIIDSEDRYVTCGVTDDICATDEAFCDACREVVQAIEKPSPP